MSFNKNSRIGDIYSWVENESQFVYSFIFLIMINKCTSGEKNSTRSYDRPINKLMYKKIIRH